jgi:hypothetical protein
MYGRMFDLNTRNELDVGLHYTIWHALYYESDYFFNIKNI